MAEDASTDQGPRSQAGSLRDRLRFAGLAGAETDLVRSFRNSLLPHVRNGLRDHFTRLQNSPAAARHFASEAQVERLFDLKTSHWDVLTDARFDSLYAERVKVLADSESRMGLDPRWMLAGHATVLEHVVAGIIEDMWPRSILGAGAKARDKAMELTRAVIRTVLLDAEIAVSLRFNEVRVNAQRALAEQREQDQSEVRDIFMPVIERLAQRDLTVRIGPDVGAHYRDLAEGFDEALDFIEAELARSSDRSRAMDAASGELSREAMGIAERTRLHAERLQTSAGALEKIAGEVEGNALATRNAERTVAETRLSVERSGAVVGEAISAMAGIEKSAEKIGQIIGVIDEIAFQTNLLALNAGIEAARAGDSGRGFAVVAQEVRSLAQRSTEAAREIKALVTSTKGQVDAGVETVGRTQDAIGSIVRQVSDISDAIGGIARTTGAHADDLGETSRVVIALGDQFHREAASATGISGSASELQTVILELDETIRQFRVRSHPGQSEARPASGRHHGHSMAGGAGMQTVLLRDDRPQSVSRHG